MMIPRVTVLAVTAALAVTAVTPPVAARPAAIDWQPCAAEGEAASADCAKLRLPVDWDHPTGEKFDFSIVRRTATDADARIGTLVFGPGGPGDSGVNRVSTDKERFSAELRRRFDIVSFDPRGVGGSSPVKCAGPAPVPPVLSSQAQFDQLLRDNQAYWQGCRGLTGAMFDHADTGSTVRDLDALRAALGERTLSFHGSSYGTLLGELYAERYPGRARAVVLESVMDHSQDTAGFLRTQAWALQDSFDAFVAWCDRDTACRLHGQDVRAVWARLMARADRGELNISTFDLVANAHGSFYAPAYPALIDLIIKLRDGGTGTPVSLRPVLAVFCADWSLPVRDYAQYRHLVQRAARVAPDVRYSAAVYAVGACLGWPQPVADPQHRLNVHTRTPVLLINARHDPADGYNWATEVARQLGRHGRLVTYAGAGHGTYGRSPQCVGRAVDAYLISLEVPPPGTVCPAI